MKHLEHFFEFAAERIRITTAVRDGGDRTTTDPVFQHLPFGHIVREDDSLTRWFRHNIRSKIEEPNSLVLACLAFRWFNSLRAGSLLKPWLLRERPWNENQILSEIHSTGRPLAVIDNVPRDAAVLALLRPFITSSLGAHAESEAWPLRYMHQHLVTYDYVTPTLAYEVALDLRHTCVLDQADDVNAWANLSPHVCRGMGLVVSDDPLEFVFGHERTIRGMLYQMRFLLEEAWSRGLTWEMSEVESALHEFHRYRISQHQGFK